MQNKYAHSLRYKIATGLLLAVVAVLAVTSTLQYISLYRLLSDGLTPPVTDSERVRDARLAVHLRSSLLLSFGSLVVILLAGDLMTTRMVVGRLKRFLRVVQQIHPENLDARVDVGGQDEIAELARAFNCLAEDLRRQTEGLASLNALAIAVSQSLNLREVLRVALDQVLELTDLRAGWITLRDEDGEELSLAATRGLPREVTLAHAECDWRRCIRSDIFESGQPQILHERPEMSCPAAEHLQTEGLFTRMCVPLKSKGRVLGVMSLAGVAANGIWAFSRDSLETLAAIGRQVGIAIENASLYERLRRTEALRRQLMERGLDLQEEERKRIARELHDQTSQRLTSILMTLGALGEAESMVEVRTYAEDLRAMAAQTLEEVHDLALELRPSLLDDLGLLAALQHLLEEFRDRIRIPADLQVLGLEDRRLPPRVETALYRIAQEALTNVARHSRASNVGVLLEHRDTSVILIVEDDGIGFDVPQVMSTHVNEGNLGLYGMRERTFLLGGKLTIESMPQEGTSIFAEIPLGSLGKSRGQDSHTDC